jgi:hypothetical protein
MEGYHEPTTLTSSARPLKAYEFISTPPIQLILDAIAAHCGVGGTIRPGVRRLAAWANYASAGRISPLLDQLASDGWISYDPSTGLITLLEDPNGGSITPRDRWIADAADDAESAPITRRDRDESHSDAEYESITARDRSAPRMEDHVLVAAAESDSESAAARYKLPCSVETITERDRSAALLLAELGADDVIIADALTARPDLTPEQIRASWAHFLPRIRAGLCTAGAFFSAIRRGQLHPAPRADPRRPLDPESYASDPAYQLGSALPDEAARRNAMYRDAHWRAVDLLGPGAAFGDMRIVVEALVDGATDDQALAELADERTAVPR